MNGKFLASASRDSTVKIWDIKTGECIKTVSGKSSITSVIYISPEKIAFSEEDEICLYHLAKEETVSLYRKPQWNIQQLNVKKHELICAAGEATLSIWNMGKDNQSHEVLKHSDSIQAINIDEAGNIITISLDQSIRFWNLNGTFQKNSKKLDSKLIYMAHSAKRKKIAVSTEKGKVYVWNIQTDEYIKLSDHKGLVGKVLFGNQTDILVTCGFFDQTIRIYEKEKCIHVLKGHERWIHDLLLTKDDSTLISSSHDTTIRIWDTKTGQCQKVLRGHTKSLTSLALSLDENKLASGSRDGTIRIWDTRNGACLMVLREHKEMIKNLAFSSDGKELYSSSHFDPAETIVLQLYTNGNIEKRKSPYCQESFTYIWNLDDGRILQKIPGAIEANQWENTNYIPIIKNRQTAIFDKKTQKEILYFPKILKNPRILQKENLLIGFHSNELYIFEIANGIQTP